MHNAYPTMTGTDIMKMLSCNSSSDLTNGLIMLLGIQAFMGHNSLIFGHVKPNFLAGVLVLGFGAIGLAGKYVLKVCDQ